MKKYRVDVVVNETYFVMGEDALAAEKAALEKLWEHQDMLIKVSKFNPGDSEYDREFAQ